jgi:amidohydrolase
VVAAHVITALQSMMTRRRDPFDEAVLSITAVNSGTAFNVIPETATMLGTVRTFGGAFYDRVPDLMQEVATGVAQAFGAKADVEYKRLIPPTVNDEAMAALMAEVAAGIVGHENVATDARTMGGEDMAFFLQRAPGCYAFVGCGNPQKGASHPHHSPHFTIDEDALPIAAELLSRTAVAYLSQAARPA